VVSYKGLQKNKLYFLDVEMPDWVTLWKRRNAIVFWAFTT